MLLETDSPLSPVDVSQYREATHCGGGIVTCVDQGERWVALVQRMDFYWVVPKGHPEAGEKVLETAHREIGQETGLWTGLQLVDELGAYEFAEHPEDEPLPKLNHFFLFERDGPRTALRTDADHRTAAWHRLRSAPEMKYPYQRRMLLEVAERYRHELGG